MTSFDWNSFPAAREARLELVPDIARDALRVLEGVLDEMNHACTFTLTDGPLGDGDTTAAVEALLPTDCRVTQLEPVPSWSELARESLPGLFIPWRPEEMWQRGSPPRELAEALGDWTLALLARLWPATAEAWSVTVECRSWYEGAYLDLAVRTTDQMWLLHLGVTD
ncbi:hypothetical protein [Asanoa iriomotensis]|uniref:hypothetical protein n=1 Tax=Asanoa iriomotensis TaxID=234613 RepID=UPI0019427CAB|nr:hypothetical protein [Asanoa iriomotensis]